MTATAATAPSSSAGHLGQMPTTVQQVLLLARFQFRDYLRSRRFVLMMGLVAAIGAIITAVVGYYRPEGLVTGVSDSNAFLGTFWGGAVTVIFVFAGVIYGGDAIAGEFQNKTGYFLMGQPMRRAAVYAGKFIAAFLASLVAVIFYLLIVEGNALFYFGTGAFSLALLESVLLGLGYLLALLGTTFLFSSLFKTSAYATLVVAILFLFGFSILEALISGLVKIEPWFVISYASNVIGYPFLSTIPPHVVTTRIGGPGSPAFTMYNPTIPEGIAIMLGYFVGTTLAGLARFEREEFT